MRVLFWGTPEFAAPALRALIGEGFELCGVVTQPDKPRGRSRSQLDPSPIKEIALEEKLPVFQPATPRDAEFREMLNLMKPEISVVVAYGHILPKDVVDLPARGTLNIHASLLPKLRGAAPIQAAIRDGFTETGVTIMRMVPQLDAGPIILQSKTPIDDDETYGELQNRLSELGALALIEALALMDIDESRETPQNDSEATFAPKVTREMARIDWTADADVVARTIRAYDPKPGAWTTLGDTEVKLFGARAHAVGGSAGVVVDADDKLRVACGRGSVVISDVQPAGKRRMLAADWARGRGISIGDVLV
jgi:methionyl-tRNA formyltransferase